jgi:hypothetical protein
MRRVLVTTFCLVVTGAEGTPAIAFAKGPSAAQLTVALSHWSHVKEAQPLRHVRCEGFKEKSTEFDCTYEQQDSRGHWAKWQTYVAIHGKRGWVLINEPGRASSGGGAKSR